MGRLRLGAGRALLLLLLLGGLSWSPASALARPSTPQRHPEAQERLPVAGETAAQRTAQEASERLMPGPKMTAIWEVLQNVSPGNWRQELVQQLILPVAWHASEMVEELRLVQAVSEHLVWQQSLGSPASSAPSSHHLCLLALLAISGCSRLLQASLGPCSLGAMGSTQEQQLEQRASLARSLMEILSNLEAALSGGQGPNRTALALEAPLLSLSVHRLISSQLGATVLSFPSKPWAARVVLPEQHALDPFVPPNVCVDVQMTSFLGSPFFPSDTSTQHVVTGTVLELDLLVGNTEIHVGHLSTPVQIFLPQALASEDWGPTVSVSPGKSLLLTVEGRWAGGSLGIQASTRPQQPLGLFLLQWDQQLLQPSAIDPGGYSWLVGSEVLLAPGGAPRFLLVPLNLSTGSSEVSIHLSAYGTQCLSWHQPSAQWREDGCLVGPQSRLVPGGHCLCTHLSFFGTSFWVAPVQVDLVRTAEYFGRVSENPILAILLGVLYALYLSGMAWACWMDMRNPPQVRATLLMGDDPCAQYGYLLRVSLQWSQSPGCSIELSISLQGSSGTSKPRRLPSPGAGTFLLHEPCPLGELQSIWLWQESPNAPQAPWYISEVTVHDLPQRKHFYFPCHAWLVAGEDGLSSSPQRFPAAPSEKAFCRPIFRQRALRDLWEEHTVLLVLQPPPHSPFTRAQRLSCGWCLLLCSALISLMFWEVPQEDAPQLCVGSVFSLSWKDVVIGAESALLAFPINFLVVFIFQRTKPRRRNREPRQAPSTGLSVPDGPSSPQVAVLEHLRNAVGVLSRGTEWLEPQHPLLPSLSLEELLQLLGRLVLADEGQPKTLHDAEEPKSSSSLHKVYCSRFLLRKLQLVACLLEELEAGSSPACPPQALQLVQEMAGALDARLSSGQHGHHKRCQWCLPWWGALVGWALLASLSTISTFFILLYGFHYGKESTERWLISTAVSLGQSLLVLQPLKVVCFAIFFALLLKKAEDEVPAEEGSLDPPDDRLSSHQ
ncbi:polycystic kidney disease protein 1-like 2 isoform X3 [Sceloporus undulatus]|uniref:polycystic kidney disease protein 1-like 2 isoform X3 n=1 Tax=Sceloporus undulatus TaxID=8520 RepID=UPI001C4A79AC|nr:polycystic kidney disease protein 1-like 2 isoform X3 [Sceloporus undulatus]